MRFAALLPLVLALGCHPAPPPDVVYPDDATGLNAEAFIEQAVAQEWPLNVFYDEFGFPTVQEEGGQFYLLYDCRDASVRLTVSREKFDRGTIDVFEGEQY